VKWTIDVWRRQRMGAWAARGEPTPDGKKILSGLAVDEGVSTADPEHC